MRIRTSAVAITVVTAAAGLSVALAPTASAVTAKPGDFNGDGIADLVVASPGATVGGSTAAGSVTVTYGSADGVSPTRSVTVTQNSSGVPGGAESGDRFGSSYATGDLDGDGYTDLVVGAEGETLSGSRTTGSVTVLWGGANGLTQGGVAVGNPLAADPESWTKRFGHQVAVGDFDGDGRAQLAAVSDHDLWTFGNGFTRTATPTPVLSGQEDQYTTLTAGDFRGTGRVQLATTGPQDCDGYGCQFAAVYAADADGKVVREKTLQVPNSGTSDEDDVTFSAAAGDVNHDGYTDLVTGQGWSYTTAAGYVYVRYGSADGLAAHRTAKLDQNTAGVPGANENGDRLGASVAVGDVTGDGYADVVAGAPGETVDGVTQTGEVVLFKGAASGLTGTGAQAFHQATSGVPGASEAYDWFGSAVRVIDVNGNGKADVAVAARGEDVFAGATKAGVDGSDWVLRGSASGLTTSHATSFSAKSFGFTDPNGEFGTVLGG
ncbi:FG-GAP-like repeat-containing protein [Streptomyces sp. SAJ15]|uniref:FG-GAP-like repeat-containing protein n=1 Tax=Streptomyces sp. SAJ15 TaxID=2011095 RepID=UPI0016433539|nr:FG-GAP-like repeat-containing protein [Streptomyces sp. SAJ15]